MDGKLTSWLSGKQRDCPQTTENHKQVFTKIKTKEVLNEDTLRDSDKENLQLNTESMDKNVKVKKLARKDSKEGRGKFKKKLSNGVCSEESSGENEEAVKEVEQPRKRWNQTKKRSSDGTHEEKRPTTMKQPTRKAAIDALLDDEIKQNGVDADVDDIDMKNDSDDEVIFQTQVKKTKFLDQLKSPESDKREKKTVDASPIRPLTCYFKFKRNTSEIPYGRMNSETKSEILFNDMLAKEAKHDTSELLLLF